MMSVPRKSLLPRPPAPPSHDPPTDPPVFSESAFPPSVPTEMPPNPQVAVSMAMPVTDPPRPVIPPPAFSESAFPPSVPTEMFPNPRVAVSMAMPVTDPPRSVIPPPPTRLTRPLTASGKDQGPAVIPLQTLNDPPPAQQSGGGSVADPGGVVDIQALHNKGKSGDEAGSDSETSSAPSIEHFNISFEYHKTFREHKGAKATDYCKNKLDNIYSCMLYGSYNAYLYVCGGILAIIWGCILGTIAFLQTWFISPMSRLFMVIMKGCLPLVCEPMAFCLKIFMQSKGGAGGFGVDGIAGGLGV